LDAVSNLSLSAQGVDVQNLISVNLAIATLRVCEKKTVLVVGFLLAYLFLVSSIGHIFPAILTLNGSNNVLLQQLMPFCGIRDKLLHLGVKVPQKPQNRVMNRHFKAKLARYLNLHIETTASIPTNFCTVIKATKCPSWVVQT